MRWIRWTRNAKCTILWPMLKIRLARVGKRGHATFRIVVTEHTRPPKSGSLTSLGSYDPHTNTVRVDAERLKLYLSRGAKPSPTVHNLLVERKIIEGKKVAAWKPPKKEEKPAS
ncbi:MAG: small subunit ribosomal protein S16 [Parcubacteria group bacterium Gr01-1014_38]|nr:MAG: small subunit ribosomal protein S16 [Parcubacteria group bacterium Gr01-1014_38]